MNPLYRRTRRRPSSGKAAPASASATAEIRRLRSQLTRTRALLSRAHDERRLSERRFRSVISQQFQFMVILSPDGRVLEFSDQLKQGGKVPPEQVIGRLFWDTVWWEHLPEMRALWPERLRQAALSAGPVFSEDVFNSSSGKLRVASAAVTAVKDAAGQVDCFVVQAADITERKRAEIERHRLEAQLRESQKLQAIGTLAGGIAHDFNNILGAILGNLALAQQDLEPGHAAQVRLAQIHKAGGRARSLVHRILAFSRRQPHEFVVQPLQPVLEETIALLRTTLPAGVALDVRFSDEPLWVSADATQIQQVLMNLCTNASHAMPNGHGRIEVGLERMPAPEPLATGAACDDCAQLWVRDDGSGMDEATRPRIFEPFFSTKATTDGSGLGLSVVHGIVAEHGGTITVDSAPGKGSTFRVLLPLAVGTDERPPPPTGSVAAPRGQGRHVLYVDDDEMMIVMVHSLLQHAGFRVTTCHDAQTAVAAVHADPAGFDVVVTDFNMPHGSGLDVARAVIAIRPELPVVISSGYLSDELRSAAAATGVRHLLQKEHTVEELCDLLRQVLKDEPAATAVPPRNA